MGLDIAMTNLAGCHTLIDAAHHAEAIAEDSADRAAVEMKTHLEHLRHTYQRIDRRRIDR